MGLKDGHDNIGALRADERLEGWKIGRMGIGALWAICLRLRRSGERDNFKDEVRKLRECLNQDEWDDWMTRMFVSNVIGTLIL